MLWHTIFLLISPMPLPMTDHIEDVRIVPFRQTILKVVPREKTNPVIITGPSKISTRQKIKAKQLEIPFGEYKMPPQPQGYIKCLRYDFF